MNATKAIGERIKRIASVICRTINIKAPTTNTIAAIAKNRDSNRLRMVRSKLERLLPELSRICEMFNPSTSRAPRLIPCDVAVGSMVIAA